MSNGVVLEVADCAGRCLNRLHLGRRTAVDFDAEALTHEALERFLDGRWTWNRDNHPSVIEFLKSRIPSLISNALTSAEYHRGREIPRRNDGSENIDAITPADPLDPAVSDLYSFTATPYEAILQTLDDELANQFWRALEKAAQSVTDVKIRTELEAVLIAVYAGNDDGEIAEVTELPAEVVYRRFYKLGDLAEQVAAKLRERPASVEGR